MRDRGDAWTQGRPQTSPYIPISITPPLARLDLFPLRGRDRLIRQILPNAKEGSPDHKAVHVLYGLGGSGKSHVALGVAKRFTSYYGRDRVWWIKLDRINSGMQALAATLGADRATIESAWTGGASAIDLVWDLLSRQVRRWLLIIDNADVPRELAPDGGNVSDGNGWVRQPPRHLGLVVVTTKDGSPSTWGEFSAVHHVQRLSQEDGAGLLCELAPNAGSQEEAKALTEALGGLPLALRGAGTYLRSVTEGNVWSVSARIRTFDAYRRALTGTSRSHPAEPDGVEELLSTELIDKVWSISLELVSERVPQAPRLLRLLAYLDQAPAPYPAFLDAARLRESRLFSEVTAAHITAALNAFDSFKLVDFAQQDAPDPRYAHVLTVHPVVRVIARRHQEAQEARDLNAVILRLLAPPAASLDPDDLANRPYWHLLVPHTVRAVIDFVDSLTATTEAGPDDTSLMAMELARLSLRYLISRGMSTQRWEPFVEPFIERWAALGHDTEHPSLLALRHELARARPPG